MQSYDHVAVNRIGTVNETVIAGATGGAWGFNYSYDRFGNMWVSSTTNYALAPGAPSQQSHINAATNRLGKVGESRKGKLGDRLLISEVVSAQERAREA
jgi:hypothetical protein